MEINKPTSIIIALVVSLAIFFLFVLPKYNESIELGKELENKQYQHEGRVDYYLNLPNILENIESHQDALGKIESALPLDFDSAEIISFLGEKARESGMQIATINFSQLELDRNFSDDDIGGKIQKVSFRIDLSGSYYGFKSFLNSLEKSARLLEVNSIAFSSDRGVSLSKFKSASQLYDFTLGIQTHTY